MVRETSGLTAPVTLRLVGGGVSSGGNDGKAFRVIDGDETYTAFGFHLHSRGRLSGFVTLFAIAGS